MKGGGFGGVRGLGVIGGKKELKRIIYNCGLKGGAASGQGFFHNEKEPFSPMGAAPPLVAVFFV